jgi:hypothetical protein
MIKSVKLRFDKWHHSTAKAHLLTYRGKEVWLPKKLAWDFQVAGNDLHAWATIPSWLFEKITGHNPDELMEEQGTFGMKEYYGAIPHTIIEHHKPERKDPVESNHIPELKK